MKKKKFLLVSIVVVVLVIALIVIFNNTGAKPITYTYNPQDTTSNSNSNDYSLYLDKIKNTYGEVTSPKDKEVSVAGVDYSTTLSDLNSSSLVVYTKEELNITAEDVNDKLLYTPEKGSVTWEINVPEAGFYNIELSYYPKHERKQMLLFYQKFLHH